MGRRFSVYSLDLLFERLGRQPLIYAKWPVVPDWKITYIFHFIGNLFSFSVPTKAVIQQVEFLDSVSGTE